MSDARLDAIAEIENKISEDENETSASHNDTDEKEAETEITKDDVDKQRKLVEAEIARIQEENKKRGEEQSDTLQSVATETARTAEQVSQQAASFVKGVGANVGEVLAQARRPGGLFLPIGLLILLFLAIIPVNGYSRLGWLWRVLIGDASLSGEATTLANQQKALATLQTSNLALLNLPPSQLPAAPAAPAASALLGGLSGSPTSPTKAAATTPSTIKVTPASQQASKALAARQAQVHQPAQSHPTNGQYHYQGG